MNFPLMPKSTYPMIIIGITAPKSRALSRNHASVQHDALLYFDDDQSGSAPDFLQAVFFTQTPDALRSHVDDMFSNTSYGGGYLNRSLSDPKETYEKFYQHIAERVFTRLHQTSTSYDEMTAEWKFTAYFLSPKSTTLQTLDTWVLQARVETQARRRSA